MMVSLEDYHNINDVINRSCHYSDYGDWERLKDLHTPDCVTELVGLNIRFVGVDQQIVHARHSYEYARGKNRHYNHNLITEVVSENEVLAIYYVQQLIADESFGKSQIGSTAKMEDRLVRTSSGWKIAGRSFHGDQLFSLSDEEMKALS